MSQITVEELEIVIKAKIDSEIKKIGVTLAAQFKSAEAALQPLQQKVQALSAAIAKVGQNTGEPAKKSFNQMQAAIDQAQAKSDKASAKIMQRMSQQASKEEAVAQKRAESMQRAADAIIARERSICEAVERTISKMQSQANAAQSMPASPVEGPVKSYKTASQILPDKSKADVHSQAQAVALDQANRVVEQSFLRIQRALEAMKQVSANVTGSVAANLENVNQRIQAQQTLLDQLRDKFTQAMTTQGVTENTSRLKAQLLAAEGAMIRLVNQYNKVVDGSEKATHGAEKIKKKVDSTEQSAKKLPNSFSRTAQAAKSIKPQIDKASDSTKKFHQAAKTATTKVESLFKRLGKAILAALPFLALTQAFRKLASFVGNGIKDAINAPEIENMFRVALGNMAAEADRFAKQFKKSLGVDEYATKQMVGTFNNMIATMGIGTQTAYNMSKSLTILANDMASLYNVPTEQAFENLQSAMSGQSEAVRKYGYILNETTIKEVALRHGIVQQGQTLNENQKVLARYLALMEQSKNAQGDMARTIGSLQNQLRILRGNISAAGRAIGEAFIPFLEAVVPWLNAFAIVLQRVGVALARFTYSLFGRNYDAEKKKQQDALGKLESITGGLEDTAEAEKDVGKEADKAKKKIQGMLAPFDELYVIQQKTEIEDEESKPPENPNIPGLEWDVPTLEVPEGESPLEQMADRIIAKLRDLFKVFRQAWESEGQNTIDAIKYGLGSVLDALKAIGRSFSEVWNNGTGLEFLENVLRIVQLIFNILGDIASAFTRAWKAAGAGTALIQQIFDALIAVMELVLSIGNAFRKAWNDSRGVEIWSAILSIITNVFAIVENLANRLKVAWEANDNGVKIWGHILDIVRDVLGFLDRISEATASWAAQLDFGPLVGSFENLLGVIEKLVDSILNGLGWAYENVLLPFGTWLIQTAAPAFLDAIAAILASDVWKDAAKSIKDLYENSLKPLAQWTGEKIMELFDWIKNNGDAAATIVLNIGKAFLIWKSIKFANTIATDFLSMVNVIKNSSLIKILGGIGNAFKNMGGTAATQTEKVHFSFKEMVGNIRTSLSSLASAIASKLKGIASGKSSGLVVMLSKLGTTVIPAIQSAVAWITGTALPAISSAVGGAVTAIAAATGLSVGWVVAIGVAIAAAVAAIVMNWDAVAKFFTETIPQWWENDVTPWFRVDKWKELFSSISEGIKSAVEDFKKNWIEPIQSWWVENVQPWFELKRWEELLYNIGFAMGTAVKEFVTYWSQAISNWWENDVTPWFHLSRWKELMSSIWTSITEAVQKFKNNWIVPITSWWNDNVAPWFTLKRWQDLLSTTWTAIGEAVSKFATEWNTKIKSWWENDVVHWFGLARWMLLGKQAVQGLLNGVKGIWDGAVSLGENFIQGFKDALGIASPSKEMETAGQYIDQGLSQGINIYNYLVASAIDQLAAVILGLKEKLSENSEELYEIGASITKSLAEGIIGNTNVVLDALTQTVECITSSLKEQLQVEEYSMVFFAFGLSVVQGISEGIRQNFPLIQETIQELAQIMLTALKETFAMMEEGGGESQGTGIGGQQTGGGMFYQFGGKLMTGLLQGITDTVPIVLESIAAASTQIVDAFKTAFVIDEISQVFYDFGTLFMQSIANGIQKSTELVQQQIEALKEIIVALYTEFIETFSETLNKDLTSINGIVAEQMDEMVSLVSSAVDDAAREITSLISKINSAIAKVRELKTASSSAGSYSYGGGYSTGTVARNIPKFASGAVLRTPTVGLMAEYPGASSNPEIVTPQNILHETMIDAMFPAVAALSEKLDALIEAVQQSGVEIKGDAAEFLQVIKKADEERSIMSGQSLFAPY